MDLDNSSDIGKKISALNEYLRSLGSVAVAFSGGVDSTFLLKTAHDVLGERAVAVTESSCFVPERDIRAAREFCASNGIRLFELEANPLDDEDIRKNPTNRCYFCKKSLYADMKNLARENGILHVAEGTNVDDMGDYRPGLLALEELGIKSPLRECGFTKDEIRLASKEAGLPTWNKPSSPCLATRFAYGETLTLERIRMVEQAEGFLLERGFSQFRVRAHGNVARIEVMPGDMERLLAIRSEVAAEIKRLGFDFVAMDLSGFKSGSMNAGVRG